ncbi:hypothetical protein OK074_4118 [Actinobacteria bacterium OK074]|nr:hypothetical protein OK074_4118 [Actinobacteria bacterium OK074]
MSGQSPRSGPPPAMTAQEVDETLSALARASASLLQECAVAQRRMEELEALSEAEIGQRAGKHGSSCDAESELLSVRLKLAVDSAKGHRDAAREFVCWWTDAALSAWKSAARGTPLPHARMRAAAPNTLLDEAELAVLPRADEHTRKLVELGVFLGAPPPVPAQGHAEDTAALTTDLAARSGLRIRRGETGEAEVVDDDDPEGRRRRLWGDFWLEHQIPALPEPDELDLLLARTPTEVAERLRDATKTVLQAAMAGLRIAEIEDTEGPWAPAQIAEYERSWDQLSRLTGFLADYARTITDGLPEIRAAQETD